MTTTALVTGASGFCGQAMAHFLRARGIAVLALQREHFSTSDSAGSAPSAERLVSALRGQHLDFVFHLVGTSHCSEAGQLYEANVLMTVALFETLRLLQQHPVVTLVGSAAEYGRVMMADLPLRETAPERPVDAYGRSKLAQTHVGRLAAQAGFRVVLTRPFNIVGAAMPRRLALGNFLRQIAEAIPTGRCTLHVGNLAGSRDFVSIDDAVRAWWELAQKPEAAGRTINICSGVPTRIAHLVELIVAASPIPVEVWPDPVLSRHQDLPEHYGSNEQLRGLLGWTPGPLDATVMSRIVQQHLSSVCPH